MGIKEDRDYPKVEKIDDDLYLDRIVKVFYRNDIIPEKYDKHRDIYAIVVLDIDRQKEDEVE